MNKIIVGNDLQKVLGNHVKNVSNNYCQKFIQCDRKIGLCVCWINVTMS